MPFPEVPNPLDRMWGGDGPPNQNPDDPWAQLPPENQLSPWQYYGYNEYGEPALLDMDKWQFEMLYGGGGGGGGGGPPRPPRGQ